MSDSERAVAPPRVPNEAMIAAWRRLYPHTTSSFVIVDAWQAMYDAWAKSAAPEPRENFALTINHQRREWHRPYITGAEIRALGIDVAPDHAVYHIMELADEPVPDDLSVNIRSGCERFFSGPRTTTQGTAAPAVAPAIDDLIARLRGEAASEIDPMMHMTGQMLCEEAADALTAMRGEIARLEQGWISDCPKHSGAVYLYCLACRAEAAESALAQATAEAMEWAVSRWRAEVEHRPLVNVHRRTLDDTWRQVIRHFGGDPDALVGPSHDALVAAPKGE